MPKSTKTLMEQARDIVRKAYANKDATNPRKDAIEQMCAKLKMASGKKMARTTAATYHAHCITYFREQEQAKAEEKASKGKPVWSAFKTKQGVVTSVGLFCTAKAAKAFNAEFRHHGVEKGVVEVGDKIAA